MVNGLFFSPDPHVHQRVLRGLDDLSTREAQCLELLICGRAPKDIASLFGIHPAAIHPIIRRIREKLGVETITQAAAYVALIEAEQRPAERPRITGTFVHF